MVWDMYKMFVFNMLIIGVKVWRRELVDSGVLVSGFLHNSLQIVQVEDFV